jgi:hypothetical protein
MVADNPDEKIELKTFCAEIQNDHKALAQEQVNYKDLPHVSSVCQKEILENYMAIKKEVQTIIQTEIERMLDTPELADLIIKKEI